MTGTGPQVVAVLDRPSTRWLGFVPILTIVDGQRMLSGIANRPCEVIDDSRWEALQEGRTLKPEAPLPLNSELTPQTCALWLGHEWRTNAKALGLDPVANPGVWRMDQSPRRFSSEGEVCFVSADVAYSILDRWLNTAARAALALGRQTERVAALMRWCIPADQRTQAVVYFSKTNEEERSRRLQHYLRLRSDAGRPLSEAELLAEIKAVGERFRHNITRRLRTGNRILPRVVKPPFLRAA